MSSSDTCSNSVRYQRYSDLVAAESYLATSDSYECKCSESASGCEILKLRNEICDAVLSVAVDDLLEVIDEAALGRAFLEYLQLAIRSNDVPASKRRLGPTQALLQLRADVFGDDIAEKLLSVDIEWMRILSHSASSLSGTDVESQALALSSRNAFLSDQQIPPEVRICAVYLWRSLFAFFVLHYLLEKRENHEFTAELAEISLKGVTRGRNLFDSEFVKRAIIANGEREQLITYAFDEAAKGNGYFSISDAAE
ncbi:MAG TPA: hypothetical protein VIV60_19055 [Polyangiaceae bacterium]